MKLIERQSIIVSKIVAQIEAGGLDPWQCPWVKGAAFGFPINAASRARYRGGNVIGLWAEALHRGYTSPEWATYVQWLKLGAQVRRGESAAWIIVYGTSDSDDDGEPRKRYLRAFPVFNAQQVDGFDAAHTATGCELVSHRHVDRFKRATGARFVYGTDRAYYAPAQDMIFMPHRRAFANSDDYCATELHELIHWTGAAHRLGRLDHVTTAEEYAREELVAELGCAFLCADLRVKPSPRADHAAYLAHWLDAMKADPAYLFKVASLASRAAFYLASGGLAVEPVQLLLPDLAA